MSKADTANDAAFSPKATVGDQNLTMTVPKIGPTKVISCRVVAMVAFVDASRLSPTTEGSAAVSAGRYGAASVYVTKTAATTTVTPAPPAVARHNVNMVTHLARSSPTSNRLRSTRSASAPAGCSEQGPRSEPRGSCDREANRSSSAIDEEPHESDPEDPISQPRHDLHPDESADRRRRSARPHRQRRPISTFTPSGDDPPASGVERAWRDRIGPDGNRHHSLETTVHRMFTSTSPGCREPSAITMAHTGHGEPCLQAAR